MAVAWAERWQIAPGPMRTVRGSLCSHGSGDRKGLAVATGKARAPNLVLRYIRETERRESREEFAAAIVNAGRELGDNHLACDARLVARWEDGDVECPRPAYQRALTALTGRPFHLLGFRPRNAIELPSTDDLAPGRLSLQVDEEGQVWATIGRRTFLVGTSAALLTRMGLTETGELLTESPLVGNADLFGFMAFMNERWPDVRLSRPHPDYGVDYNALLPANRAVEGTAVQFQLQEARTMGGRAIVAVKDQLRWKDFARGGGRGLVAATSRASGRPRFFVMDVREARRHAALHGEASVAVPEAYELDDLTFALLWACASLDTGIQADDQELTVALAELAPYEGLPSSAVSREAAADLGTTAHMWLGSDFCARHILRNMEHLPDTPVFWTREQTGAEACPWLLFDHKYAYLRATSERFGDGLLARMFCVPQRAVAGSPLYERILLLLAIALMEATGIKVQVCDDPAYSDVEGFVLGGQGQAIIANWVRGEGIWHVDTARRPSVLSDFREASGYASAHSVIDAPSPAARLRAMADYLGIDWPWLQGRCQQLAQAGTTALLRPCSRHISTAGADAACAYIGQAGEGDA